MIFKDKSKPNMVEISKSKETVHPATWFTLGYLAANNEVQIISVEKHMIRVTGSKDVLESICQADWEAFDEVVTA
jgi:hypothetical protein